MIVNNENDPPYPHLSKAEIRARLERVEVRMMQMDTELLGGHSPDEIFQLNKIEAGMFLAAHLLEEASYADLANGLVAPSYATQELTKFAVDLGEKLVRWHGIDGIQP
jgi:hypothetical protein